MGLGYATVEFLARKGAKVYMAARSEKRALDAIKQLEAEGIEKGQVEWLCLDLSDLRKAKDAAEEFLKREKRLDILGALSEALSKKKEPHLLCVVNNAGMYVCSSRYFWRVLSHFLVQIIRTVHSRSRHWPIKCDGDQVRLSNPSLKV